MKRFLALLLILALLPVCGLALGETTYGLNETVTCRNGLRITATQIRESTGSSWNKPDSGKVFLLVQFTIENTTREEQSISSILMFDAYEDDFTLEFDFGALMCADNTIDMSIAAGKKGRGEMGWSVSRNWQTLEVHFKPEVWGSEDVVFVFNRSDLLR